MLVGEVNGSQSRRPHPAMSARESVSEPTGSDSRALVALDPLQDHFGNTVSHHYAPFVAQLVATKDQHPQTRERRRADPNDVLAAYRATATLTA